VPGSIGSPKQRGAVGYASCAPSASRSTATVACWWRALKERGVSIGHILVDGTIEPHAATEERLLGRAGAVDDLFGGRAVRLAQAYRARAHKVAAPLKA
jgi:hypothetical protein